VEELVQLVFKTYGIVGLLLIAPLVALKFMWNHTRDLQVQLQAASDRVNGVHDQRVKDAKEIAEKLMDMIQEHAALSKETNMALDRVGDMLSILQNNAMALRAGVVLHRKKSSGDEG
jgi:hypothetical protein